MAERYLNQGNFVTKYVLRLHLQELTEGRQADGQMPPRR